MQKRMAVTLFPDMNLHEDNKDIVKFVLCTANSPYPLKDNKIFGNWIADMAEEMYNEGDLEQGENGIKQHKDKTKGNIFLLMKGYCDVIAAPLNTQLGKLCLQPFQDKVALCITNSMEFLQKKYEEYTKIFIEKGKAYHELYEDKSQMSASRRSDLKSMKISLKSSQRSNKKN
jgi:hypothetical protein